MHTPTHTHLFTTIKGSLWCCEVSLSASLKQERSVHGVRLRPLNKHLNHRIGGRPCCYPLMCGLSFKTRQTTLHLVIAAPSQCRGGGHSTNTKRDREKAREAVRLADMASPIIDGTLSLYSLYSSPGS